MPHITWTRLTKIFRSKQASEY